jgi:hypothetical protein
MLILACAATIMALSYSHNLSGQRMGINVQLRSESGEIFDEVIDVKMTLSRAAQTEFSGTRLLQYVVPWGDAMFNQAQSKNLAMDIRDVMEDTKGIQLHELLARILTLVDRLSSNPDIYLWFMGD